MNELSERLRNFEGKLKFKEPSGFKGKLKEFQRKGVAWLYAVEKGILADSCGLGKTVEALGLLQFLKQRGEMQRAMIIVPSASVFQWADEIKRFTDLKMVCPSRKDKIGRFCIYSTDGWEVMLINYEIVVRDISYLESMGFGVIIADEASVFKNAATKTSQAVKRLTSLDCCERVICMSATPIQNNLFDLHSILETLSSDRILFGNRAWFASRYVRQNKTFDFIGNRRISRFEIVGYQNVDELKGRVSPYILKRTIEQVELELPDLITEYVWNDLYPQQRVIYDELKKQTIKLGRAGKVRELKKNIHTLQQSCDGIGSLGPDYADVSVKLDKIIELLTGSLLYDKVVVFSRYKTTIARLTARLDKEGIGWVRITGDEDKFQREVDRKRFWEDPAVRVCIGTTALEMSLNLQIARYMIAIDLIYNPARVEQLIGRIRRIGSFHRSVVLLILLTNDTLESRMLEIVKKKQALISAVFDEESEIFENLSASELLSLIEG